MWIHRCWTCTRGASWPASLVPSGARSPPGPPPRSEAGRRRVVAAALRAVAETLANTPAVARSSYVDPQVLDLYARGELAGLAPAVGRARSTRVAELALVQLLRESTG